MSRKVISCSQIISLLEQEPLVYHAQLGAFHSEKHQHEKAQLVYAQQGLLHLHIGDKKLFLPGNYCAFIPAATPHQIWSYSHGLFIRSIHFDVLAEQPPLPKQAVVFAASALLKEMIMYTEKWSGQQEQEGFKKEFFNVLQRLLPAEIAHAVTVYLPTTSHEKLGQVVEYLQAHLQEKQTMSSVAKRFGFSQRTLTRLFSSHLGVSFSAYMKRARMIKALELMENGYNNVSQIAFQVGYESLSTFSNNFLEIHNKRPIAFISMNKSS
jgi:AraC-like DNA-binding protein